MLLDTLLRIQIVVFQFSSSKIGSAGKAWLNGTVHEVEFEQPYVGSDAGFSV